MRRYRSYFNGIVLSVIGIVIVGILRLSVDIPTTFLGTIREVSEVSLYVFMIASWGISMRSRVMHKSIRGCLFLMAFFMVGWVFVREIKWHYSIDLNMERILWYCFYIPMIEIPMLGYIAAKRVGTAYKDAINKKDILLQAIGIILMLFVLTNDLHKQVFKLVSLQDLDNYSYGFGYLIIVLWIAFFLIATITIIIKKAYSEKGPKRFLPLFFVVLLMVYALLYARDSSNTGVGFVELMVMFNWTMIVIWETCVVLGMIPVNNYYEEIFKGATIGAQIVAEDGKIYASAGDAKHLLPSEFVNLKKNDFLEYDDHTILQLHPISCGSVVWQEDISQIKELVEKLRSYQLELKEGNALEEEEGKARIRKSKIEEQNRLYTLLSDEMAEGLKIIHKEAECVLGTDDYDLCRKKLATLNIIGTYLKRRSNFIILSESEKLIPVEEFELCLNETRKNLLFCGMKLDYRLDIHSDFSLEKLLCIYDAFEDELMKRIFACESFMFTVTETEEGYKTTYSGKNTFDNKEEKS